MATCPRCGTTLKDEYGMSQCPGCGAFSFINMDGQAVVQQPEPAPIPESGESDGSNDAMWSESNFETPSSLHEGPTHPTPGGAASPPDFVDPIESIVDVNADDFQAFDPFAPMPAVDATPAAATPVDEPPAAEPAPFEAEPALGPAGDPLNLNDFANSEISSAKDGPLLFRVLISGIDTREIRDSIREVVEDPRFAWDSNEIVSKISRGVLTIDGLAPVKASILITRIKRLPVQIRWEQYAIAQGHHP